jgi:D-aminopeptidase
VTVVCPRGAARGGPVFAGCHRLNGNGELTGLEWVRESGLLTTPIAITNTHSVGVVRDALVAASVDGSDARWSLPVVGETFDGLLNDINGFHVNVGGGTGMICHEFKGGIGTASRVLREAAGGYAVGVLVQANYGKRSWLRIDGVRVGEAIPVSEVPSPWDEEEGRRRPAAGSGSIIVVVATDAPLLPHQCERLAQRAGLGIARVGGTGGHSSGDLFIAFSTGNALPAGTGDDFDPVGLSTYDVRVVGDIVVDELFDAVIEATEEAIVNALVAARTVVGRDGIIAHAIPHDRLVEVMRAAGR